MSREVKRKLLILSVVHLLCGAAVGEEPQQGFIAHMANLRIPRLGDALP